MAESAENKLFRFFQLEFARINTRLDKLEQQNRSIIAHQRTIRDLQLENTEAVKEVRGDLQKMIDLPSKRTFPLKSKEEVDSVARNFGSSEKEADIKNEIGYVLSSAPKTDWLRFVITDGVVATYHTSGEIKNKNFIKHIMTNIIITGDKAFTALVTQAKNRVYAKSRRDEQKAQKSDERGNAKEKLGTENPEEGGEEETDEQDTDEQDTDEESPAYSPVKKMKLI